MTRFITVGAAQMGPVGRNESRTAVVVRLLEMLREAKGRGCDLVVFTECALTPFFPRFWEEDPNACDRWFESEMPNPVTQILFNEAKKLGIGFHLGYAELAEENGKSRHYNASMLVGPDGQIIGKYRKIHLPGLDTKEGDNPHRCYEKRYFDAGNLGFRAWRAFGGVIGMCLGNDRRWPETYRVLGLQGAEMILLGYNTAADHPDHPELDHLTNFHSMLSMQAGAYQNGCFVIGVAKAGQQEGISQIGRSAIIAPSGEVVTQCTTLSDELVVHRCNLDQTAFYKNQIFNFAARRQIEAYSLIAETRGPIPPFEPGQDLDPTMKAQQGPIGEEKTSAEPPIEKPAEPEPKPLPEKKSLRDQPTDPIDAIHDVLSAVYQYSPLQIESITIQAARALELMKSQDDGAETAAEKTGQPKTAPSAKELLTKAESQPEEIPLPLLPISEDIGWLPGRFAKNSPKASTDHVTATVNRLIKDYRYPEETARKIAELAEAAWQQMQALEESPSSEPAPDSLDVSKEHPKQDEPGGGKPLTTYFSKSPMDKTFPALTSEEAVHVFSVLTEKYGYSPKAARGIAELASTASRRWQEATDGFNPVAGPAKEPPAAKVPQGSASQSPAEVASAVLQEAAAPAPAAESVNDPIAVIPCPQCAFPLKINQSNLSLLGRKARCPQCQTKFRLPESV